MAEKLKFFIEGDAKSGEKALSAIDSRVQDVTKSFAKWGLAVTGAVATLSIKEATEFETKIAEVSTLLEDTSGLEATEQAVKDLAIQYGQFPDDQVESIYAIISAGAEDAATAVQTLEAANRLAIGGVTAVATAADGLTSILNAYGEEAGTVVDVSDAMFVAMQAGKTTIGELSNSIGNVAPIAAEAGVELDELLGATAALTKGGVTTNVAMTGLRQVIASVLKPTAEAQKEAKKLGLEFDSTALESKGLQSFLEDLTEKTGGNKDSLTQLFGSVEALGPIFALTGSQAESFSDIMERMEDKTGATETAFGKMDETGGQALRRLTAIGNVAAITLGDQLLPAVADLANFLAGPTADGVNKIEDAFLFLKASAFSVLGGISDAILTMITPLAKAQALINDLMGIEISEASGFLALAADLEMFSAAMEDGAVETFRARDAAEEYNIQLREKALLLRETEVGVRKLKEAEEEEGAQTEIQAERLSKQNQKIIDSQAVKFASLKGMAESAALEDEERETLRHERLLASIEAERTILEEKGILSQEAQGTLDEAEMNAQVVHLSNMNNLEEVAQGAKRVMTVQNLNEIASLLMGGNKKLFKIGQKLALAQAAISLPSAVMQSFEKGGGFPWGLIPAGIMAAKGAVEISKIKSQSPPQAHDGLDRNPSEGTFLLKKDEMVLDSGTSEEVRKAAKSAAGGKGGRGDISISIENIEIKTALTINNLKSWIETDLAPGIVDAVRKGISFGLQEEEVF